MKCPILLAVLIILMVVYSSIASPVAESTLLQKETALEKETIDVMGPLSPSQLIEDRPQLLGSPPK
jgi:hypothetical protein